MLTDVKINLENLYGQNSDNSQFFEELFFHFFLAQISGLLFIEGDFNTALVTNLDRLKGTDNTYTK